MHQFFKTIELIATVKQTWTVSEDSCESIYGVGLDALDSNAVLAVDGSDEDIFIALFEGDCEIADHRFVVSDLQQRPDE
jgi:hypothetical protein